MDAKRNTAAEDALSEFVAGGGEVGALELASLIVDDRVAQRVAMAWSATAPRWRHPRGSKPDGEAEAWSWLWSRVEVDIDSVAAVAGVRRSIAARKFEVLLAARMIFPDGSIARAASQVVRARMTALLGVRRRRSIGEESRPPSA